MWGVIENTQRNGVDIEVAFMDRGFASVDNIQEIGRLDVDYIIPLPGNDKLYGIMQEYHDGNESALRQ